MASVVAEGKSLWIVRNLVGSEGKSKKSENFHFLSVKCEASEDCTPFYVVEVAASWKFLLIDRR